MTSSPRFSRRPGTLLSASLLGLGLAVALPLLPVACGDDSGDTSSSGTPGGTGTGTGTGGGSSSGTNSGGESSSSFNASSGTSTASGTDGGILDDGSACAAETQLAKPVPADLYVMLDKSGSMNETVSGGKTRWQAVTQALSAFVAQSPDTDGLGVGLQYFPLFKSAPKACAGPADCVGGFCDTKTGFCLPEPSYACDSATYAKPAVPIALLPGNKAALDASLAGTKPFGSTPTLHALGGAIDHAKTWSAAHPDRKAIVVLATDGEPKVCDDNPATDPDEDIAKVAAVAKAGLDGTPSIPTFVIGVGDALDSLNAIAAAGGTDKAVLIGDNTDITAEFVAALNEISKAFACEFEIPQPSSGDLDYTKVNVKYTPGTGDPVLFGQVANAAACEGQEEAWYYDDPAAPTKILLCPATCEALKKDPSGKIDVLLGCKTVVAVPK